MDSEPRLCWGFFVSASFVGDLQEGRYYIDLHRPASGTRGGIDKFTEPTIYCALCAYSQRIVPAVDHTIVGTLRNRFAGRD